MSAPVTAVRVTRNAWMQGYRAALRAPFANPESELSSAIPADSTPFQRSQFEAGWRSVMRCERASEVK